MLKTVKFELKTTTTSRGQFTISLTGDIDLYTAPELKTELHRLIEAGATRIVIDLTSATFIDSTTLGVLLGALKRFRPTGGELVLVCSDPNIRRIFEITLLDRVFPIFETLASAGAPSSAS